MEQKPSQVAQLRAALAEVMANRLVFTPEAHAHVVRTLMDKIRVLQTIPLTSSSGSDEIRLVSVMFVDVKDSTLMAQKLKEPEVWKRLIGNTHRLLATAVEEWGGEVGQYLGDGLLCFFGAHRSQSDDAVRAVSCALEIQVKMRLYADEIASEFSFDFAIRTAISTGKVVVGMIGTDERKEFLALGQTTNLAARLQALCPPGEVLIDAQTYRQVRKIFATETYAPVKLKGFDELIEHYRVIERQPQSALTSIATQIGGVELPFVGRDQELEMLRRTWAQVVTSGEMHSVMLWGDIGTGKTRLLQEFAHTITYETVGQNIINMSGVYERRLVSFNLLRNLLGTACALSDDVSPEVAEQRIVRYITSQWNHPDAQEVAAVLGYLTGYGFRDNPHVAAIKHGSQEQTLSEGFARWMQNLMSAGPLLILVDNLQWADRSSLAMLESLVEMLSAYPVMFIYAARRELLAGERLTLQKHPDHIEITLEALDETGSGRLVSTILDAVDNVPPSMAAVIIERTEGNPLFIEEFLRMLYDSGVIKQDNGGRGKVNRYLFSTMTSTLPSGLVGLLQARLDDLTPETRYVVQAAAVVGQTFWESVVSSLVEFDTRAILNELVGRGIVLHHVESRFAQEQEYSFRNTLYREASYEMLPRETRQIYHRKVARWFVSRISDRREYLPVLAEHLLQGEQFEQAIYVYDEAVEDRLNRGLHRETLKLIENGMGLSSNMPRTVALPVVSRLWSAQGRALNALNRFEEASAASQTALMLMSELPADEFVNDRVQAARVLGSTYRSLGRYDDAVEALNTAYNLLPEEADPAFVAMVLRAFGSLARQRGYLDEALAYHRRALVASENAADIRGIAGALAQMGLIALDRGDAARALNYFDRVLEINRDTENLYYQMLDLRHIGAAYRSVFAYELAIEVLDQADAIQRQIHFDDVLMGAHRGQCLIALDRVDEGLRLLREAAGRGSQDAFDRHQIQLALIQGLAMTGNFQECQENAVPFLAEAQKHNPILYGRGLLWLGLAQHALEELGATDLLLQALQQEIEYAGRDTWLCYYALGTVSQDMQESVQYYKKAAMILRSIASSLSKRPELQLALTNNAFARVIFAIQ